MNKCKVMNILNYIDANGEDETRRILSTFSCSKNVEVEHFVRNNAINFAKQKISVTYLVLNSEAELMAIFSLAHKANKISVGSLSSTARRKMGRFSRIDEEANSYNISAFLIAQLGKNYTNGLNLQITGNEIMEMALSVLKVVQRQIGGGVVYLECEDNPNLLSFYQNDSNRFARFGERYLPDGSMKYIQLLRLL